MSTKDIKIGDFSPEVQKLINQALKAVLAQAADLPTVFCLYGRNEEPTAAECAHVSEILRTVICDQIIYNGTKEYVAAALRFIIRDIEGWLIGKDDAQPLKSSMEEYTAIFGVDVSVSTILELKALSRSLSPETDVAGVIKIAHNNDDRGLSSCMKAFIEANKEGVGIDYGQHNVGIVVDSIFFDFPKDHKVIKELFEVVKKYTKEQRGGPQ